jgi:hypothetical protein
MYQPGITVPVETKMGITTMCSMKWINGLLMAGMIVLAGCGGGGAGGSSGGSTSTASTVTLTSVDSSGGVDNAIATDNSDTVTITALVQDDNNVGMSGQTVQFSTSSGLIVSSTTTTDDNGEITATFRSGTADLTNRTAIITASVTGTSATGSLPIQIAGSTLTASSSSSSVAVGTPVTLTATTLVANSAVAVGQTVRFSIASSSLGGGTLSQTSQTTDGNGTASISFTGTAAGQVNILIEWLDGSGNVSISTTHVFTVQATGAAFEITTPASSPWPVTLAGSQAITVSTPATINGVAVANIRYATTLGTWNGGVSKTVTVARTAATDSQTFTAGASAGNATIQVDSLDGSGVVLATAKRIFALSATAASANSIDLQSNVTVLSPSSGGSSSTATLSARVLDNANNAVGGASVLFELVNPTGSGEQIDPVVVSTDSNGFARSVFTAGSVSTQQTSQIRASVVGTAITDSLNITVGGTAGSVAIGTSTTITSVSSDTAYELPVTVMVTDSNGVAVNGATVSLSIWGVTYSKGTRPVADIGGTVGCHASLSDTDANEDVNENLILDAGEDVDGPSGTADGALWPPSPAAGSVPATVVTGSNGTATFNWTYLKQYADWVTARIRATVVVQGTEATTTTTQILSASQPDIEDCVLPVSPFN